MWRLKGDVHTVSLMRDIHDRMPVIVPPADYGAWLDPVNQDVAKLKRFIASYPADRMVAYPVSKAVSYARNEGAKLIAPHRSNRKLKTQDRRRLRRYERRWLVERFFAWLQWKRRLLVRWEYYAANFLGFVQLASITMLLRQF